MKKLIFALVCHLLIYPSICVSQETIDLFEIYEKNSAPGDFYEVFEDSPYFSISEENINGMVKKADWNDKDLIEVHGNVQGNTMGFNFRFKRSHLGGQRTNFFILKSLKWQNMNNGLDFKVKLGDVLIAKSSQNYDQVLQALDKDKTIILTNKPNDTKEIKSELKFTHKYGKLEGIITFKMPYKGSRKKRLKQGYISEIIVYNPEVLPSLREYIDLAPGRYKTKADKLELLVDLPPFAIHGSLALKPSKLTFKKVGGDLHYTHFIVKDYKSSQAKENVILFKVNDQVLNDYYGLSPGINARRFLPLKVYDSRKNSYLFTIDKIFVSKNLSFEGMEVKRMPLNNGLLFTGRITPSGNYQGYFCKDLQADELYKCFRGDYASVNEVPKLLPDHAALAKFNKKGIKDVSWVFDDGTEIKHWRTLYPQYIRPYKLYKGKQIYIVYDIPRGTDMMTNINYLLPTGSPEFAFLWFTGNSNYQTLWLYPSKVVDQYSLGVGSGVTRVEQISYDPIKNLANINGKEWFEGIKGLTFRTNAEYKQHLEEEKQRHIAEKNKRLKREWAEAQKNRQRYFEARKSNTCPVCAGYGRAYLPYIKTVEESEIVDETDYHYTVKTTTEDQVWYSITKCSRCGGSGKVK